MVLAKNNGVMEKLTMVFKSTATKKASENKTGQMVTDILVPGKMICFMVTVSSGGMIVCILVNGLKTKCMVMAPCFLQIHISFWEHSKMTKKMAKAFICGRTEQLTMATGKMVSKTASVSTSRKTSIVKVCH